MNNDFLPWIRPTLLGPFWTSWGFTTLAHMTLGLSVATLGHVTGVGFDDWIVAIMLVSFFSALVVVGLIASDVTLLKLKLRALPTGLSVWASSLLAPVGVWMAWHFFGMGDGDSMLELVLRIMIPIFAVPFVLRLMFGRAP